MFRKSSSARRGGFGRSNQSSYRRNGRTIGFSRGGGRGARGGSRIDPVRFINKTPTALNEAVFVPKHTFRDFGFSETIQKTLIKLLYEKPTAIQDGAIPFILEGRDLIGIANTGTGKTGAFLLPIMQNLLSGRIQGQVLIIVPTRELAQQIESELFKFSFGLKMYSSVCVGGASMYTQRMALSRRPQFIIGTPGRLKDHINRGNLRLDKISTFVLDEVDRMLDMGFINDINYIIAKMPVSRQTLCFSATTSSEIDQLLKKMLKDPVTVSVKTSETSKHIEQDVVRAGSNEHKLELLTAMLSLKEFSKVIIFGTTKFGVQRLADFLTQKHFKAESIHGNKSQSQRYRALKDFKDNKINILVATDVAARGLDIPNVTHVINFDQPQTYDDYIHRIGRTGRAGKRGKALTFVGNY